MGRLSRRLKNKGLLKKKKADPAATDPGTENNPPVPDAPAPESPTPPPKKGSARRRALGRMKSRSAGRPGTRVGRARGKSPGRVPEHLPEGKLTIGHWTELIKEHPDFVNAYLERGILLYKTGRKENALYDFNKAISLQPSNARALLFRARIFAAQRKWKEALMDLEIALEEGEGKNSSALHLAATCSLKLHDLDQALQYLQDELDTPVSHLPSLLLRADLYLRKENYDAAEKDLEKALAQDPKNATALSGRARIRITRGNFGKAMEDLDASVHANPDLPSPWHDRGIVRLKKKDYSGAIIDLEKSLRLAPDQAVDPRFAEAYLHRATTAFQSKIWHKAIADFQQVKRLKPDLLPTEKLAEAYCRNAREFAEKAAWPGAVRGWESLQEIRPLDDGENEEFLSALYYMAKVLSSEGRHDDALAQLARVLHERPDRAIDPLFAPSFGHRGIQCFQAKQFESAVTELRRAVLFAPENPDYREYLGKTLRSLGKESEAAEHFEKLLSLRPAATLDPMCFRSFAERAKERLLKNEVDAAITDFETAARFLPDIRNHQDYIKAYVVRCDLLLQEDHVEAGLMALEHALSIKPGLSLQPHVAAAYCKRAEIRLKMKDDERALADANRALEIEPNNPNTHILLGKIHQQRMDFSDAITHLKKALALDPAREKILQPLLKRLENEVG